MNSPKRLDSVFNGKIKKFCLFLILINGKNLIVRLTVLFSNLLWLFWTLLFLKTENWKADPWQKYHILLLLKANKSSGIYPKPTRKKFILFISITLILC